MFSVDVTNVPTLGSYIVALSKYESITPICGSNNVRPLEQRSKQQFTINLTRATGIDGIEYPAVGCMLHSSNVVVYLSNGEIHYNSCGYNTMSTNAFASKVMPRGVYASSHRGEAMVTGGDNLSKIQGDGPIKLYQESGVWVVHEPTTPHCYYLRHKPMTIERRRAKPFMDFCTSMVSVLGSQDNYNRAGAYSSTTMLEVYEAIGDEDKWADMAELLLARAYDSRDKSFSLSSIKINIVDAIKFTKAAELIERRVMTDFSSKASANEHYYNSQFTNSSRWL